MYYGSKIEVARTMRHGPWGGSREQWQDEVGSMEIFVHRLLWRLRGRLMSSVATGKGSGESST